MPLVKRYRPGAFPQFTDADENLRGYLRDEFNKISLILGDMGDAADSQREVLTAPRNYFVRTDGVDTNDGLSNTSAGAFKTLQRAIDALGDLDFNGFTPQVFVAAGTYTDGVTLAAPFLGGTANLIGDTTTPSNVVISTTGTAITLQNQSALSLAGFKLVSSAGQGLYLDRGSFTNIFGKMEYGGAAGARIFADNDSFVTVSADYTFSGNSPFGLLVSSVSKIIHNSAVTITLSGTPAFSWHVYSQIGSLIYLDPVTYSGAATGNRFYVAEGANITTGGKGLNFIPGNSAGVQALNGVYT